MSLGAVPRWNRATVHRILRDRSYLGEVFYQDVWHPGTHRKDLGRILREHFDTPDGPSSFMVLMTPAWAQHLLMVQFRDGRAMRLEVHG